MTLTCIGDTHGNHHLLKIPETDIIVHTGDVSSMGTEREILDFLDWFQKLPQKHKIFIAGNHDFHFEKITPEALKSIIPPGVIYLQNEGVQIGAHFFWGSAYTPGLSGFAFFRERGKEILQEWKKIPQQTDILVTHTPPYGILDEVSRGQSVGCEELKKVVERLNPSYHIFGHIHEGYGIIKRKNTSYVNASSFSITQTEANNPIVVELLS